MTKWVRLAISTPTADGGQISGEVIGIENPYGNLVTNIGAGYLRKLGVNHGDHVRVRLGKLEFSVPFVHTFSDVPVHKSLLYIDSRDRVALAVNQGNFAVQYKVRAPEALIVEKRP